MDECWAGKDKHDKCEDTSGVFSPGRIWAVIEKDEGITKYKERHDTVWAYLFVQEAGFLLTGCAIQREIEAIFRAILVFHLLFQISFPWDSGLLKMFQIATAIFLEHMSIVCCVLLGQKETSESGQQIYPRLLSEISTVLLTNV